MLQSLIKTIYPPQCVMCETRTEGGFALCGSCWAQTPFIEGLICDQCGQPALGAEDTGAGIQCDDCMATARPWSKGRAALVYKDKARRFILSLKHGDRTDLARAAGPWLARAGRDILNESSMIVPVPLHRFRLIRRRYNQAALLAHQLARVLDLDVGADVLRRVKNTKPLEGHTKDQRFEALDKTIIVDPARKPFVHGRRIVLVDDVMTSGATFAAATEACLNAGADDVCVLALARVIKDA